MFDQVIIDYVHNIGEGPYVKINRTGNYTKRFLDFIQLCKLQNIDINVIFDPTISFAEIIFCIKQNKGPTICNCGNIIKNSRLGRKWCSIACRSNDKKYCKGISTTKYKLYNDDAWKLAVESKKISTTLKHYGVRYPMQNVDIFKKQQDACFMKDKNGLHGYEPYVYPFLHQLYPDLMLGTTYIKEYNFNIKWKGMDNKHHRSYPDFFSKNANAFIEIKSEYTRNLHDEKLIYCSNRLNELNIGYIIITVKPRKHKNTFICETFNHKFIS